MGLMSTAACSTFLTQEAFGCPFRGRGGRSYASMLEGMSASLELGHPGDRGIGHNVQDRPANVK